MNSWYLERYLFLIAGIVSLTGLTLGFFVNPWGFVFNLLVGLNLILFSFTGFCPMSYFLKKIGIPSLADLKGANR
ncbi:hypothetical protein DLM76_20875 [Leptospira yasudae]|uniref:Inner membrane protein YgaP-like transmembrane domain-containing protein n=1 Tax=Leptospira yasudae TaxID=2202201 RepID=A0ABX9LXE5_9LEPT|nr:DUF2892 domain-containing protein [Leptospira yasudae]RHX77536.1 hypothetical protein DLM77_20700 [Leptospira yasudae]RHX90174.1 hypothetical protein DLM76_20875 [Leptospira yasudae]TGK31360.1 DUF2892 domain-containing protein [Leptospira yasudae]TGM06376.1 DUF2892 domain-containing protein [Leptospira yasudae]TGM95993.1 DUF2892 domain-containing protein [Leptospira yasudae]